MNGGGRSQPRLLLEDASAFIGILNSLTGDRAAINQIRSKQSAIGLLKVSSQAVDKALSGESGLMMESTHASVQLLSAYTPLDALGLRWALVTEIQADEALADIAKLSDELIMKVLIAIVIGAVIATLAAWMVGNGISKPIRDSISQIQRMSRDNDLTVRLSEQGSDELRQLAQALNRMLSHLQDTICQFAHTTDKLNSYTQTITHNMTGTRNSASVTVQVGEVNAIVNELSDEAMELSKRMGQFRY